MKKAKNKTYSSKYMIVGVALALATLGYFGYKNLFTKPDINKIDDGGNSKGDKAAKDKLKNTTPKSGNTNTQENKMPAYPKKIPAIQNNDSTYTNPKTPNAGR